MFLLRLILLAFLLLLLLVATAPVLLLWSGIQSEPLVQPVASARQEDIGRIKALFQANDPRDLRDGETRTFTLTARDMDIALRALLPLADRQGVRVRVEPGVATADYTVSLPANPVGDYLNLSLVMRESQGELRVDGVRFGDRALPGWVLSPAIAAAGAMLDARFEEYARAHEALQSVVLRADAADITYRWDRALAKRIEQRGRDMMLPGEDRERALAYYRELARISRTLGKSAPLERLLQPLFSKALERSRGGDAAAENRALLLVVGTVLNRSSMHRLVGGDPADLLPTHQYVQWTLDGRNDLAQHFCISAAIAVAGGGVLADSIGVFKELDDSRGGSGFSFADLLADRSGVELGTAATGAQATAIQRQMAGAGLRQGDFMPPIDHLPEGLMEMEFRQRYRDLDDARYAQVKQEVESRIAALPLYR